MEPMVSRASSGDTSAAIVASPQNLYGQHPAGCTHALEVMSAVVPQAKVQLLSCDGLLERRIVAVEQAPDCRPDEVGAIR